MKILEERIRKDGVVKAGNVLKVDSFLNHQMDVELFNEMGREFKRLFADRPINKILTIEASGIGIACIVAQHFQVPVVFAKKTQSINIDGEVYTTKIESFTHKRVYDVIVSKKYIGPEDHILIIDDFLANGCAVQGLINLIRDAGATVEGVGIAIEKGQQAGGRMLRDQGIRVESLAIIDSMDDAAGEIVFRQNGESAVPRGLRRGRRRRNLHQDNVFPDLTDAFPGNDNVVFPSQKAAESGGSRDDQSSDPAGAAVEFHIRRTAHGTAGADVDNFLLLQINEAHGNPFFLSI